MGSPEHRLTIAVANNDVKTILQVFVETIPTLERARFTLWDVKMMKINLATFVRRLGGVERIDTLEDDIWSITGMSMMSENVY